MHDAYSEAHQDASAGSTGVGHIVRIADQVETQSVPITSGFSAVLSSDRSVPLLAGTQPVSVQVTVVYSLN
jgi:uncharacterized protein YggE